MHEKGGSYLRGGSDGREGLYVCNIGFPSRELYAAADRPKKIYMLGSMGLASSIGLGLALVRPERKVIVLDGDGSVLMNLGALATIAHNALENYLLIILDNCCYGSTGSQPTCTSQRTELGLGGQGSRSSAGTHRHHARGPNRCSFRSRRSSGQGSSRERRCPPHRYHPGAYNR